LIHERVECKRRGSQNLQETCFPTSPGGVPSTCIHTTARGRSAPFPPLSTISQNPTFASHTLNAASLSTMTFPHPEATTDNCPVECLPPSRWHSSNPFSQSLPSRLTALHFFRPSDHRSSHLPLVARGRRAVEHGIIFLRASLASQSRFQQVFDSIRFLTVR